MGWEIQLWGANAAEPQRKVGPNELPVEVPKLLETTMAKKEEQKDLVNIVLTLARIIVSLVDIGVRMWGHHL